MNFENWCNGELSKIGHHFNNKVIKNLMLSNMSITNNVLLIYSSKKKKIRKILIIFVMDN